MKSSVGSSTSSRASPGYSGKPLAVKLGFRPAMRVVARAAPPEFVTWLGPIPKDTVINSRIVERFDLAIIFATQRCDLREQVPKLVARAGPTGMIWIAWPKKSAKVASDLDENVVREIGLALGWVDVKVCAISEVWSGLKFLRRKK